MRIFEIQTLIIELKHEDDAEAKNYWRCWILYSGFDWSNFIEENPVPSTLLHRVVQRHILHKLEGRAV